MPARDIALIWLPAGLEPGSAYARPEYPRRHYGTLKGAVDAALDLYESERKKGLLPWLRAGAGDGAYVFNISGIRLLADAYDEGVKASKLQR